MGKFAPRYSLAANFDPDQFDAVDSGLGDSLSRQIRDARELP
jgi:hypothetical protein